MAVRTLLIVLLVTLLFARKGCPDSWMLPQPTLVPSADGRWYVILQPEETSWDARFQLVKRAAGAAPRTAVRPLEDPPEESESLKPDKGDVVVARGTCHQPMEVRCLDGGRGFLLFESYAMLGTKTSLQLRDGKGRVVWTDRLADLFSAKEIADAFPHTTSSIWWYEGFWLDEPRGEIGIVTRPNEGVGLLRVNLEDGKSRPLERGALLPQLSRGTAAERILVVETAEKLQVPGLAKAAREAFAAESAPDLARAHLALLLHRAGDERGVAFVVGVAKPGRPLALRRYAVAQLHTLLGVKALPALKDAMRSEDHGVFAAAEKGLRSLGAAAVDTLIGMLEDEEAEDRYRAGAVYALANMTHVAVRALPTLDRLGNEASPALARAADRAAQSIREAAAKQAPPK